MALKGNKFYARKLLTGSLAMTMAEASAKIAKLLALPLLTYYLTPADFGIISSIKMVQGMLMLIYNPGLLSGVSRIYYETQDEDLRKEYIGSGLLFFIIISVSISVVLLLLGESFFNRIFSEFELYPYGLIAIILSLFIQPKRLWSALMTFQYKVPKVALFSFSGMMLDIAISLFLVVVLLMGVEGRVIGLIAGSMLVGVYGLIVLLKHSKGFFSLKRSWQLFLYGLPLAPAIWAYSIMDIADRFLIERFVGLEELGLYSIGYTISSVPLFLSLGFRKMWNPIFYENMNANNYKIIRVLIKYFVLGMAFICCSLILFAEELITIVLDKDFSASSTIIPWVSGGIFFLGIIPVTSAFITYDKKFSKISINAGISAGLNIILNILLLPKMGMIGAAVATFLSYISYLILNIRTGWDTITHVISLWLFLVPILVLGVSITTYYLLPFSWLNVLLKVGLILSMVALLYIFGYFTREEISGLKQVFTKSKNG